MRKTGVIRGTFIRRVQKENALVSKLRVQQKKNKKLVSFSFRFLINSVNEAVPTAAAINVTVYCSTPVLEGYFSQF